MSNIFNIFFAKITFIAIMVFVGCFWRIMKTKLIILFAIFSSFLFATSKELETESSYIKGMQAYEKGDCDEAIKQFDIYVSASKDLSKIIEYLAYCEIEKEQYSLAIDHLEKIFTSNNNNNDIIELLFKLYIKDGKYEKARPLVSIIDTIAKDENELYFLIASLYFKTQEFKRTLEYITQFKADSKSEVYKEYLWLKGVTNFELKNYDEAKVVFAELQLLPNLSDEMKKNVDVMVKEIKNIEKNEEQSNNIAVTFLTQILFDSNITSQPPFSNHYKTDLPGSPVIPESDLTAMGIRNETFTAFNYFPINKKRHLASVGLNIFSGFHYPYVIDELFDPQKYDMILGGGNLSYQFSHKFTDTNILKLGSVYFIDLLFMDSTNFTFYNYSNNIFLYAGFSETESTNTIISVLLSKKDFNQEYLNENIESQNALYVKASLEQIFKINELNYISVGGAYLKNDSDGAAFNHSGLEGFVNINLLLFNFLSIKSKFIVNSRWYQSYNINNTSKIERNDFEFGITNLISFKLTKLLEMGFSYSYFKNDSDLENYTYTKHIGGIYFGLNY